MAIKTSAAYLDSITPSNNVFIPDGAELTLLDAGDDIKAKIGGREFKGIKIQIEGREEIIPVSNLALGVIEAPDIYVNKGKDKLECVQFVGKSFVEWLKNKANGATEVEWPNRVKIHRRLPRAIRKDSLKGGLEMYNSIDYAKGGKAYEKLEFVPQVRKNATGGLYNPSVYVLEVLN